MSQSKALVASAYVGHFPIKMRFMEGAPVKVVEIKCHAFNCTNELLVPTGHTQRRKADGPLPLAQVERRLDEEGWTYKNGVRQPYCPACSLQRRPPRLIPAVPQPEPEIIEPPDPFLLTIEGIIPPTNAEVVAVKMPVAQSQLSVVAKPEKPELVASPRTRGLGDNRRIMDALDKAYDTLKGRYTGEHTDDSIATELDVPRIWITEVRAQFFGEGTGNEAGLKVLTDIATLRNDLKAVEAKVEAAMLEADRIKARIDRLENMVRRFA